MKEGISYQPLIQQWEQYLAAGGTGEVTDFAQWVLSQAPSPTLPQPKPDFQYAEVFEQQSDMAGVPPARALAGYYIGRLNKFVRHYGKSLFAELGYSTWDEFGILATVDEKKQCTKKEVILENLIEISTGMDMIRRMINNEWLEEKINVHDRRQKLLFITKKGKKLLYLTYQKLFELPDVLADLPEGDRQTLVRILGHLDRFHTEKIGPKG